MSDWLDGPKLVAWMEENGLDCPKRQLGAYEYRVRRWKQGSAASVWVADDVLTTIGCCLGELPDDLYREPPMRNKIPPATARKAVKLIESGMNPTDAARVLRIDPKTAARYARLEAA